MQHSSERPEHPELLGSAESSEHTARSLPSSSSAAASEQQHCCCCCCAGITATEVRANGAPAKRRIRLQPGSTRSIGRSGNRSSSSGGHSRSSKQHILYPDRSERPYTDTYRRQENSFELELRLAVVALCVFVLRSSLSGVTGVDNGRQDCRQTTSVPGGISLPEYQQQNQQLTAREDLARPFGVANGMSLDQYLKSFLETLWWQEAKVTAGDDVFQKEFDSLRRQSTPAGEKNAQEALKSVNRPKNRYKDIVPFDYARVVLSQYPGVPGSDYVNASLIRGASGSSRAYIAAQGPLPHTVTDFWRMIWEFNVSVIVMTCNEIEGDRYKCEKYWPDQVGERQQHGNVSVTLEGWKQVCPDFLVRTLRARCGQTTRTIRQFHYTTWPDHGVPAIISPIIELVRLVRDCQPSEALPVLVHCSAGCGRTGTFCAIDYVHGLVRYGKLNSNLSLFKIIQEMRQQRVAMVQTRDQYVLVHKVVGALFEQQLKLLDSHIYQNIDSLLQGRSNQAGGSPGRLERSKSMGSLEGRLVGKATVIRRAQQPNGQQIASGRLFGATLIPKGHEQRGGAFERPAAGDTNAQGHDNNANHQLQQQQSHIQPSLDEELMKTRRTSSGTLWTQV